MPKYLINVLLACLFVLPAWAQDDEAAGETADTVAEQPGQADSQPADADSDQSGEVADEAVDDSDLDEQSYEEDDDDFVPTEEIPADEPIPFPSNI